MVLEPADGGVLDAVNATYLGKYSGEAAREAVSEPVRSRTLRVLPA